MTDFVEHLVENRELSKELTDMTELVLLEVKQAHPWVYNWITLHMKDPRNATKKYERDFLRLYSQWKAATAPS
jgi:hypothetical protein